jgi:hypothetical protein
MKKCGLAYAQKWDWIKDQAASIKDSFVESVKGWLLTTLVTKFTEWIASLLIPGGAILRLIQGIYNLVMWFVNNIQKIIRWVNAVMDSLGNIALGAIAAAIGFIVNAMKLIIPIILNFVASILNISGIVEAVKKIIDKIAKPIHAAIYRAIDWIVAKVKKMFGKGGEEEEKPHDGKGATASDSSIGKVVSFSDEKEQHQLWIVVKGESVEVMVASHNPSPVIRKLAEWRKTSLKSNDEKQKNAGPRIDKAEELYGKIMAEAKDEHQKIKAVNENHDQKVLAEVEKEDEKIEKEEDTLASIMKELFIIFGKAEMDAETIAEAHGKFQAITDDANKSVGNNASELIKQRLLSFDQINAAYETLTIKKKGPWLYWAFYGTAVEKYADQTVRNNYSEEFETINKGGNYPDFEGKKGSKYEELVFDITTTNQGTIDSHVGRTRNKKKAANYNNVIITTYNRGSKEKEKQIIKAMNQEIGKSFKEEDLKE